MFLKVTVQKIGRGPVSSASTTISGLIRTRFGGASCRNQPGRNGWRADGGGDPTYTAPIPRRMMPFTLFFASFHCRSDSGLPPFSVSI